MVLVLLPVFFFLPSSIWATLSCTGTGTFCAVAAVSPCGELEGLEGDQEEGTVQGGSENAAGSGRHCHPWERRYERAL